MTRDRPLPQDDGLLQDGNHVLNDLGQPVGHAVPGWTARRLPPAAPLEGGWCRLEVLDPDRHAVALHDANRADRDGRMWTYLPYGPFQGLGSYRAWLDGMRGRPDPQFFAVLDRHLRRPVGLAAYQRIDPEHGTVEVGHVAFSPVLQRSTAATEAMALMMARAFDELGYRRYEWKCDALNGPSRRAAERLGFTYEGTFRQALVVKGRNRDTAWFSVTDKDWPRLRAAHARWLSPSNFGDDGRQLEALSTLTRR